MWSKWKHVMPLILAVLLALTPAAAAQDIWIPETEPTKAPDDFSDYETATVQRGSVSYDYVTSSAVESYPHTQDVLCAHSGTLLREYLVARGDTVKKGDTVKLKSGAKTYAGKGLASFVYNRKHKVKEVVADRAVITYAGIVVAAVNVADLTVV